jgi:putative ABC transport system substrate-binding protein
MNPPPPEHGDRLERARKQQRAAWALAAGLLIVMGGLYLWSERLKPVEPPAATGGPASLPGYQPDGTAAPGEPEPVAFAEERCRPWHVSAAEAPPSPGFRLLVLSSPLSDPEGFALAGLGEECGPNLQVVTVEKLGQGELAARIAGASPAFGAVVALGPTAVKRARSEVPELPLLFALVPNPVGAGLDAPGAAGVSPWVPMGPLARHLHALLPASKKRVAVIFPEVFRPQAELAARALGRQSSLAPLASSEELPGLLAGLAGRADAWLVLPDRKLIDRAAFERLQVAAEQARIPLCVPDEQHVRAGAYAGAATDLHRVGAQVCRLAGALERGRLPEGQRVFCPEYSFAALNEMLVRKLAYILEPDRLRQAKVLRWH